MDSPDPGTYLLARVGGKVVAGLHEHAEGTAHGWDFYVAVEDLDSTLARIGELGGDSGEGAHDIPGSGRTAVVTDAGGARVCLWQPSGFNGAELVNETGGWSWNDLATRDPAAAEGFYAGLFGWSFQQLAPGYWSISRGDLLIGGMRTIGRGFARVPAELAAVLRGGRGRRRRTSSPRARRHGDRPAQGGAGRPLPGGRGPCRSDPWPARDGAGGRRQGRGLAPGLKSDPLGRYFPGPRLDWSSRWSPSPI